MRLLEPRIGELRLQTEISDIDLLPPSVGWRTEYSKKRTPLRESVSMTIAAGFTCTDGIMIGADTEYSGSGKFHGSKVRRYLSDDVGEYLVAGAGHVTYSGMAQDMLEEGLYENKHLFHLPDANKDIHRFRKVLRATIKAVHDYIKGYPYASEDHAEDRPKIELVVGVRFKRTGETSLIHVGMGGGVRTVHDAGIFIGAGAEVAQSFSRIVWHQLFPAETMLPIAMFILYQSKMSAESCGGDTELYRLPKTKGMGVYSDAAIAETIEEGMRLALAESRDKGGMSDELFEERVNEYATSLKNIRKAVQQAQVSKEFALEILKKRIKQHRDKEKTA